MPDPLVLNLGFASLEDGITALLAMHAPCAAGVTVVNIDSGFGAAMAVQRLARVACTPRKGESR